MNPHEEVKLKDFDAHLVVILGNIQVANKELEGVLAKQSAAQSDLEALKSQTADAETRLADAIARAHSEANRIAKAQKELDADKESHELAKLAHSKRVESDLASIEGQRTEINAEVATLKESLKSLKEQEATAQAVVDALKTEESGLSTTVNSLKGERRELETTIESLTQLSATDKEQHTRDVAARLKELDGINTQIEENKKKVEAPLQLLAEEQKKDEMRKSDIEIWRVRIINKVKELYPDIDPKI